MKNNFPSNGIKQGDFVEVRGSYGGIWVMA